VSGGRLLSLVSSKFYWPLYKEYGLKIMNISLSQFTSRFLMNFSLSVANILLESGVFDAKRDSYRKDKLVDFKNSLSLVVDYIVFIDVVYHTGHLKVANYSDVVNALATVTLPSMQNVDKLIVCSIKDCMLKGLDSALEANRLCRQVLVQNPVDVEDVGVSFYSSIISLLLMYMIKSSPGFEGENINGEIRRNRLLLESLILFISSDKPLQIRAANELNCALSAAVDSFLSVLDNNEDAQNSDHIVRSAVKNLFADLVSDLLTKISKDSVDTSSVC
jgi:hypothetical protein